MFKLLCSLAVLVAIVAAVPVHKIVESEAGPVADAVTEQATTDAQDVTEAVIKMETAPDAEAAPDTKVAPDAKSMIEESAAGHASETVSDSEKVTNPEAAILILKVAASDMEAAQPIEEAAAAEPAVEGNNKVLKPLILPQLVESPAPDTKEDSEAEKPLTLPQIIIVEPTKIEEEEIIANDKVEKDSDASAPAAKEHTKIAKPLILPQLAVAEEPTKTEDKEVKSDKDDKDLETQSSVWGGGWNTYVPGWHAPTVSAWAYPAKSYVAYYPAAVPTYTAHAHAHAHWPRYNEWLW